MLNLYNYLTASKKYPERATHSEATSIVTNNATTLLFAVIALLEDLGINPDIQKVSSGFRPSDVNKLILNAAKTSLHQRGLAIDLLDDISQSMGKKIASRPDLLRKYGLFIEDLNSTKGKVTNWVHLDKSSTRLDRPSRSFIP